LQIACGGGFQCTGDDHVFHGAHVARL
jgi:hypothetical protein